MSIDLTAQSFDISTMVAGVDGKGRPWNLEGGGDLIPDPFPFTVVNNAETSTLYAETVELTGVVAGGQITVVDGTTSNDGPNGTFDSSPKNFVTGQTYVRVEVTSNASFNVTTSVTVYVNGISSTKSVTTEASGDAVLLFEDDFASGNINKVGPDGFAWSDPKAITVTTNNPFPGGASNYSCEFLATSTGSPELSFALNDGGCSEFTFEYDMYIPDGTEPWGTIAWDAYYGGPTSFNNKLYRIWAVSDSGPEEVGASYIPQSNPHPPEGQVGPSHPDDTGAIHLSIIEFHDNTYDMNNANASHRDFSSPVNDRFVNNRGYGIFSESDRGTWIHLKWYCKVATNAIQGQEDGIMRLTKTPQGGSPVVIQNRTDVYNTSNSALPNPYREGYIFGSLNNKPPSNMIWQMSNFKFWRGEA